MKDRNLFIVFIETNKEPWYQQPWNFPDSKVHGANMGPIWVRKDPGGPHVGPMNFAIWVVNLSHDDVIKWKYFRRYWPFVREIHWSPVNSLHKGQWCGALMFLLIWAWINSWVNNGEAGGLRHHCAHYNVTVMCCDQDIPGKGNYHGFLYHQVISNRLLRNHDIITKYTKTFQHRGNGVTADASFLSGQKKVTHHDLSA